MRNPKNDAYYVRKALENIDKILGYAEGKSFEDLMADEALLDATVFRVIQMAENIKHLSEDYKRRHPNVPWGDIIGFHNGLVHNYGSINYHAFYGIVAKEVLPLKEELLKG